MGHKRTKYLVTGATGFVGSVLLQTLAETGADIASLVLPGDNADFVSRFSDVRPGDVCDTESLEKAAVDVDAVIHLAGVVDVGSTKAALMRRVNVDGTRNTAALCAKRRIKMLYCGSVHALPPVPAGQTAAETTAFDPAPVKGAYAKSKAEAARVVFEMTKHGLDAMAALPSGIIGPFERQVSHIGTLITEFLCGRLKAYIDGRYNFVDVRDVAAGISGMLKCWKNGECYILSGHEVSVREMLAVIAESSGREIPRVKLPYSFVMATSYLSEAYYHLRGKKPLFSHYSIQTLRGNCAFSNDKAASAFGFSPRPAKESLSDMTKWILAHFVEKVRNKENVYRPCPFRE